MLVTSSKALRMSSWRCWGGGVTNSAAQGGVDPLVQEYAKMHDAIDKVMTNTDIPLEQKRASIDGILSSASYYTANSVDASQRVRASELLAGVAMNAEWRMRDLPSPYSYVPDTTYVDEPNFRGSNAKNGYTWQTAEGIMMDPNATSAHELDVRTNLKMQPVMTKDGLGYQAKAGVFVGGVWAEGEDEFLGGNIEYLIGTGGSVYGTLTAVVDPRTGMPTMKADGRAALSALHAKAKYTLSQDINIPFTDVSLGKLNFEETGYLDALSVGAKVKFDASTGKIQPKYWRGAGDIDFSSPKFTFDQNDQWYNQLQDKISKWLED